MATAARPAPSTPSSSSRWASGAAWATARDGKRRYVTHVDVAARRVVVGSAAEVLRSSVVLTGPSLTWVDRPLAARCDRTRAVAQVSAHGRPAPCVVVRAGGDVEVIFDEPQRPVAPGQTVALYDALDPDAVVGAGIAA